MTFAQRRNRLTTHFSEGIPVVKRRMIVFVARFKQLTFWTTESAEVFRTFECTYFVCWIGRIHIVCRPVIYAAVYVMLLCILFFFLFGNILKQVEQSHNINVQTVV